jgi:hypothetical protein
MLSSRGITAPSAHNAAPAALHTMPVSRPTETNETIVDPIFQNRYDGDPDEIDVIWNEELVKLSANLPKTEDWRRFSFHGYY